jgi:LDH2 family malate/lactate/ureidoglycolate dehydrogenase
LFNAIFPSTRLFFVIKAFIIFLSYSNFEVSKLDQKLVKAEDLFDFCMGILGRIGVNEENARIVADNLVMANLRGVDSHGVARLPTYVERVLRGYIDPQGPIEIVKEHGATALIDAHNNFGQVAAMHAVKLVAEKIKKLGVSCVGVRNANHFGMAAYYVLKLAEKGLIGIALSNGPPAIAPWGGKKPMLGTNPLCIGFPMGKGDAIILDMAISTVARGKIRLAALKGEKIPEGWAFDENGNPTTDPVAALKGTLAPIGGPKGYGLALALDLLCGLVMGSSYLQNVKALDDFSGPSGTGFFIEAIDVEAFIPYREYEEKIAEYVKAVKDCPKREGVNEIFLPGEIEKREMERRAKVGVPLDSEVLESLKKLAERFDVKAPF